MDIPKLIVGSILLIIGLTVALQTDNSVGYFLIGFSVVIVGQGLNSK